MIIQKNSSPFLSICCLTYNHAPYIRKCLDGFLMQKTDFEFEILIHDDASKDGTEEIIREFEAKYPEIIKPIYELENQWVKGRRGSSKFNFPRVRGKYIALCEGDDYWTDPLKLQKQVDFLEANEDYGLVHTDLDEHNTVKNTWIRGLWKHGNDNKVSGDIYDLLMFNYKMGIYLCTMCFRSQFVQNNLAYDDVVNQKFMYGDVPLYLHIARSSKIGYIPESTTVRNVLSFSATQGQSFEYMLAFRRTALSIFEYFNNLKPVKTDLLKKFYSKQKQAELDICFRYHKRDEFMTLYKTMNKDDKNFRTFIQRIGILNEYSHFISRATLKVTFRLKFAQ